MRLNFKAVLPASHIEQLMYLLALLWSFNGVIIIVFITDCHGLVIAGVRGGADGIGAFV
jgi:hypothetical protein